MALNEVCLTASWFLYNLAVLLIMWHKAHKGSSCHSEGATRLRNIDRLRFLPLVEMTLT